MNEITSLSELVRTHIRSILHKKQEQYYFGTLARSSSEDSPHERAIILERLNERDKRSHSGYLIHKTSAGTYSISYILPTETLYFKFNKSHLILNIQEPQITRRIPALRQAITKEDWVTSVPMEISLSGDYLEHSKIVNELIGRFDSSGTGELWLPDFFR